MTHTATTDTNLSRRTFITTALTAAGGFALGVGLGGPRRRRTLSARPWGEEGIAIRARSTPGS